MMMKERDRKIKKIARTIALLVLMIGNMMRINGVDEDNLQNEM